MQVLKYRRRQDAGTTRVWVGPKRRRVLKVLISARGPLSAQALADEARVKLTVAQDIIQHLESAGLIGSERGPRIPGTGLFPLLYQLNYAGEAMLAAVLAPVA